jgi:Kef-type K+ transport system membrane component KefB
LIWSGLRLAAVMALLWAVTLAVPARVSIGPSVTLVAGALLLCGVYAGQLAKGVKLPRLTGYLVIGFAIGPSVLGLLPAEGVEGLHAVERLAVSLIGLAAGCELQLPILKRVGMKAAKTGARIALLTGLVLLGVMAVAVRFIPDYRGFGWPAALAVCALVASVAMSFSPTVTLAIIQETRAKGSFTEFLLAVVVVGDLVVMFAFAITSAMAQALLGGELSVAGLLKGIGLELFGSVGAGLVFGVLLTLYLALVRRELPLFVCAATLAGSEIAAHTHLSALLLSLSAGALVANVRPHDAERVAHAVARAGMPVFAVFFAATGAHLPIQALRAVGPWAVLLCLARFGMIYFGGKRFAPTEDPRVPRALWMGLISQAGVTLALAATIANEFPTVGKSVSTLLIAMVALHEIVGPLLSRRALTLAGEVPHAGKAETG